MARSPTRSLRLLRGVVGVLLGVCAVAAPVRAQDPAPERASGRGTAMAAHGRHFMVAAANPHAVDAAYRMLRRGGSAVDAAIAAQLVLTLVEPQSSGIGGGAFMLVHDARRNAPVAYDGRETAPAAATADRFLDVDGKPLSLAAAIAGGRSVGVPGVLALLGEAHRRHGRLRWATLFEPALALAEQGFAISPRLHALLAADRLFDQPRAQAYFFAAPGVPHPVGHVLRNPAYAATLRTLAAGGAGAFYRGELARDVVAAANAPPSRPGDLAESDLARYRVQVRAPVCAPYRGYRVCGMPPPSSGGVTLLQVLALLEPYPVGAFAPVSLWSVHFLSEAGRLAYADRGTYIADPDFFAVPSSLLDRGYLAARARLIATNASLGEAPPGLPPERGAARQVAWGAHDGPERPSTSHLSIVDRFGNAVAMTTSIESAFGSRRMTAGGYLLNNQLTDFSFVPVAAESPVANRVEGGKRPRSSMAPVIVYDRAGRVHLVAGSAGGSAIINHVAKTLIAILDWQLDVQQAVALPNFGSRNGPTELERDTPSAGLAPKLAALGHEVRIGDQTSGVHVILRTPRGWSGAADPRREGTARGG
ncbi:MAG: gamma-glutamyltransferase [Betaproteobacteria bacterium]|nr:gamma-glutamyltransferase [Betaproteobacteria bacterium]